MAGIKKIIEKMKSQPNGIRMAEADKVLQAYGYRLDRQKGSHCHYINTRGDVITIKEESQLKPYMLRTFWKESKEGANNYDCI